MFTAAFSIYNARLNLYESPHVLQKQILYYDTDSMIYKWAPGLPEIQIGDYLGDTTDELEGDVIKEFVSGGAKNYSYVTRGGKTECKARDFTLNIRGSAVYNIEAMKQNILPELHDPQEERRTLQVTDRYVFDRDVRNKRIKLTPSCQTIWFSV